jgi:5-methylcytosine-specific restriction endonuclease McrA
MRREQIFERDRYRCVYCGGVFPAEELTVDHVQARVRGGDRSAGNLVTACSGCNTAKGHRKAAQFLRDNSRARENFLRYALHVWPRLLRDIRDAAAARGAGDPATSRTRRGTTRR